MNFGIYKVSLGTIMLDTKNRPIVHIQSFHPLLLHSMRVRITDVHQDTCVSGAGD